MFERSSGGKGVERSPALVLACAGARALRRSSEQNERPELCGNCAIRRGRREAQRRTSPTSGERRPRTEQGRARRAEGTNRSSPPQSRRASLTRSALEMEFATSRVVRRAPPARRLRDKPTVISVSGLVTAEVHERRSAPLRAARLRANTTLATIARPTRALFTRDLAGCSCFSRRGSITRRPRAGTPSPRPRRRTPPGPPVARAECGSSAACPRRCAPGPRRDETFR